MRSGVRFVEPVRARVGVLRAVQAVGLGLLASAGISLISVLALALGVTAREADPLSRAAALGPLLTGLGGGVVAALAVTAVIALSPSVLRRDLDADPDAAPTLDGLTLVPPTGVRIIWGVCLALPGLMATIVGFLQWRADLSPTFAIVGLVGVAMLAVMVLCFRGATSADARWHARVDPLLAEHARRSAAANEADARRRESFPQGWGPPLGLWRHWLTLDAKAGRIFAVFMLAMLVLGTVAAVVKAGGNAPQWLATMLSVAIMAPIALLLLVLLEATATLTIAERRTARWARASTEHVFDTAALTRALHGRRASWFGALTVSALAGLLLTAAMAVEGTRETVPAAAEVAAPSTLVNAAVVLIAVGLAWALADIPVTAADRTRIRAACAPGSLAPSDT